MGHHKDTPKKIHLFILIKIVTFCLLSYSPNFSWMALHDFSWFYDYLLIAQLGCYWRKVARMHGWNTAYSVTVEKQFAQASADVSGGRKSLHRNKIYIEAVRGLCCGIYLLKYWLDRHGWLLWSRKCDNAISQTTNKLLESIWKISWKKYVKFWRELSARRN